MLLKRQNYIIKYLRDYKDWVKGSELAGILKVSDRTIRTDITQINSFFGKEVIYSLKGRGYKFNKLEIIEEVSGEIEIINNKERCLYILKELIKNKKGCNIFDLADMFYVSESSINNDVFRIKKTFNKLAIDYAKISVVKDRIMLKCTSIKRYELMYEFARYSFSAITIDELQKYFKNIELKKYYNMIISRFTKERYPARYLSLSKITLCIALMIESPEELIESLKMHKVSNESLQVLSHLNNDMGNLLSETSLILLASRLDRDKEMHIRETNIRRMEHCYKERYKEYKQIIIKSFNKLLLNIEEDEKVFDDLVIHTMVAIERINLGIKIYNPLRRNLISAKPLTFLYGKYVVSEIEEIENVIFDSNELSYIAEYMSIFFYKALSKLNKLPKVKVLLSVSDSRANLNFIHNELKSSLKDENIHFTCICKFYDLKEEENGEDYDLVIATSKEDGIYLASKYMVIRKEFDEPEKAKIINEIKRIRKDKLQLNILKALRKLRVEISEKDNFNDNNNSYKVSKVGIDLIYNISKNIKENKISLVIPNLNKKGNERVKFIFDVSKDSNETKDYVVFIEFISYLSSREEFVEGIRFCHTIEEVYILIAQCYIKNRT